MSYHAKDGWHFNRLDGNGVRLTKRVPVLDIDGNFASEYAVVEIVEFDEGMWNSIVASMTEAGEDRDTFDAARALHRGIVRVPSEMEAELRRLLHTIVSRAYGETSRPGYPTRTETDAEPIREAARLLGFN